MSVVVEPIDKSLAVLNYALRNVNNMRISSRQVQRLLDKCMETAEDLQQVDAKLLRSHRALALINTMVECLAWCGEYQRKFRITRFVHSVAYRERFQRLHQRLTEDFTAFTLSVQLTHAQLEWRKLEPDEVPDLLTLPTPQPIDALQAVSSGTTLDVLRDLVIV